ncbi:MAG: peptidoglycan DD-metalloendopeptidase family protein [Holosporales bacterium]|jgi:murein DD-endopeptidase MepM/ murein hydrolase activator NlpD|nr:peptidoglycan DD-metalloendopeptidase family protein [Holosporales bacterium]
MLPDFKHYIFLGELLCLSGCSRETPAPVDIKVGEPSLYLAHMPTMQSYTVKEGDTLATIASKLGVTPQMVAEANHLAPPYAIVEGQMLLYPNPSSIKGQSEESLTSHTSSVEVSESQEMSGWQSDIQVTPLESAEISEKQRTQENQVTTPNGTALGKTLNDRLKEARLNAPSGEEMIGLSYAQAKKDRAHSKEHDTSGNKAADGQKSAKAVQSTAQKSKEKTPKASEVSKPPEDTKRSSAGKGLLAWPIQGDVLSSFGQGESADGISIAGQNGTKVLAAEEGLVVYAGAKLKSFGNLVLVKHEDGLMTAYAHLSKITVRKGDYVDCRHPIGVIGKTGDVSEVQLYFEVRKNKKPVDPLIYLQKKN